jgi:hypothetical protein
MMEEAEDELDGGDDALDADGHQEDGQQQEQQKQQRQSAGYKPPWLSRLGYFHSPSLRLHNEVVNFCKMLEPTVSSFWGVFRCMGRSGSCW